MVDKGYTQTYEIDYLETFALIAKMNSVRILVSLTANYGRELEQSNVMKLFLHGELEKEIYVEVASGYGNHCMHNLIVL